MADDINELDPEDSLEDFTEPDPDPEPVTDKDSPCYVEPAEGIAPRKKK